MKYFRTLQFRILALVVILAVGATMIRFNIVVPAAEEQLAAVIGEQQWLTASYIAADVDAELDLRSATVTELAKTLPPVLLANPAGLADWLRAQRRLLAAIDGELTVYRLNGSAIASTAPLLPDYAGEQDWFNAALRKQESIIGRPYRDATRNRTSLPIAAAVYDAQRKPVAVLAGAVNLGADGFLDRLRNTPRGTSGGYLLISPEDKMFIAATDPTMAGKPTPPPGVNRLHDRAMGGYRGNGITMNARGEEEISGIASVPSTGWFVVSRMPTSEAFRPLQELRVIMARTTLVGLGVTLVVLFIALPSIFGPLRRVSQAMRDMADGRRTMGPLPLEGTEEISSLTAGFNYLVERLRDKETELKASEAGMQFLAHHDPLTSLFNRTVLQDRLDQALARGERTHSRFALLFFDLDGFKEVNDAYGHHIGDSVLVQVAARLQQGRRRTDTVARLGGDEFVILLSDLEDSAAAQAMASEVAAECVKALAVPFRAEQLTLQLSASVGISIYDGSPVSASQLLSQADIAMYQAKRSGKNRAVIYTPDITPSAMAGAASH